MVLKLRGDDTLRRRWELPVFRYHGLRVNDPNPFGG